MGYFLFLVADLVLFVWFSINIGYLLVFSLASLWHMRATSTAARVGESAQTNTQKRFVILIPAYKEDRVIDDCVASCLAQSYPKDRYEVVVISDRMSEQTNARLQQLPIHLISVHFQNSTKAKALNHAMNELTGAYDVAVVLDADNLILPAFLSEINDAFGDNRVQVVQAHRCAKNTDTPLALLDAVSEEINNSIFRKGHVNLGLSAALIGSGMCFDYALFKQTMLTIHAVGGFDRALELILLRQGVEIHYLPDTDVLDEKVQHRNDFSRQRRRWLSAQWHYLTTTLRFLPAAVRERKWDFCDKMFQQMSIPRVMLLGFSVIICLVLSLFFDVLAVKWWVLFGALCVALSVAIPRRLMRRQLLVAVLRLPYFFTLMVLNLFRLRGANRAFIHTNHGLKL